MDDFFNQIKFLISQNKILESLDLMKQKNEFLVSAPHLYDRLYLVESNYADLEKRLQIGIMAYDDYLTLASGVKWSLLKIVSELEKKNQNTNASSIIQPNLFDDHDNSSVSDYWLTDPVGKILFRFIEPINSFLSRFKNDILTTNEYIDLSVFDEDNKHCGSVTQAVDYFIEVQNKALAILGSFGSGKSTFTRRYYYVNTLKWLNDPIHHKLPLLFLLNEFNNSYPIEDWIVSNLERRVGVKAEIDEIVSLIKNNKVLLIFDGFDEMTDVPTSKNVQKNLREINRLNGIGSPVVLTSRTTFFEAEFEEVDLENFMKLYLLQMENAQIVDCVRKSLHASWIEFSKTIFEKQKILGELAKKPLFLNMIMKLYRTSSLEEIENVADLYHKITSKWIYLESTREGSRLSHRKRKILIQELSFLAFSKNVLSFSIDDIESFMAESKIYTAEEINIELVFKDISNYGFFNRNGNDYQFTHKSFMEYFTAQKLAEEISSGVFDNFEKKILYDEIFYFLSLILSNDSDLTLENTLINPKLKLVARVNSIPTIRKQLNPRAIGYLLSAHLHDKSPLVRYVCGYTLELFLEKYKAEIGEKGEDFGKQILHCHVREPNTLIKYLMSKHLFFFKLVNSEPELSNYEFEFDDSNEILIAGTFELYQRILRLNQENEIVLEGTVMVLTTFVSKQNDLWSESLHNFIINVGLNNPSARIRHVSLWSSYQLYKNRSDKFQKPEILIKLIEYLMDDSRSKIAKAAKAIFEKIQKI